MKKKKIWAWLLVLCLIITGIPKTVLANTGDNVIITLDNGVYDSSYQNNYGVVEYSTDYNPGNPSNGTWKQINDGTQYSSVTNEEPEGQNVTNNNYQIQNVNSVWIRVILEEGKNYSIKLPDKQMSLMNATPLQITGGCHISFEMDGGTPSGEMHNITLEAGEHGVIDMESPLAVGDHSNSMIFISPDYGYEIASVIIDRGMGTEYTLTTEDIENVIRDGGYAFRDITSDHSLYVTFKAMNPAPPVFTDYTSLKTRIENELYSYTNVNDSDHIKEIFCDSLWDMITHEYAGAFENKAALKTFVTIKGDGSSTDGTALNMHYYTYSVELPNRTSIGGKIYILEENTLLIKAKNKGGDTIYKKVLLTPTMNEWEEPEYKSCSATMDYDLKEDIRFGGARIEGETGATDYCASFHLLVNGARCEVSIYKPKCVCAKAIYLGENRAAAAWDFGNTPFVVLNDTTLADPFILTNYFGYKALNIVPQTDGMEIVDIRTSLPKGAVTIEDGVVSFHSNYYDSIPLSVDYKLNGVVYTGYVKIQRVGIDIQEYSSHGQAVGGTNHGTQPGIDIIWGNDDSAIYATYYYPSAQTSKVDLYCTYTWKDGTVTTSLLTERIATSADELFTATDDFCVYKGSSSNKPVSVSIIGVKTGALDNSATFGGATIGTGAGVTWTGGSR